MLTNAESELDFFSVDFSGVMYIHLVVYLPPSISRTFWSSPTGHSIPIKPQLPSAPYPWQPPFYFLSLWHWTHLDSDANSTYSLTSGTFLLFISKTHQKKMHSSWGRQKPPGTHFERLIMPITELMQGAILPEWGRLSPRSCQTEGNISALKWPVTESTFMLQMGEEFNHRGPEKPAHGNECLRDLACAPAWERKHLFWSQCD